MLLMFLLPRRSYTALKSQANCTRTTEKLDWIDEIDERGSARTANTSVHYTTASAHVFECLTGPVTSRSSPWFAHLISHWPCRPVRLVPRRYAIHALDKSQSIPAPLLFLFLRNALGLLPFITLSTGHLRRSNTLVFHQSNFLSSTIYRPGWLKLSDGCK
jgi:hypothetical protein